jgi:hypothetical protein
MGLGGLSGLGGIVPRVAAPGGLLLDQYGGAFLAYSLKRLSSSYAGAAIRVRRSSDNAEQDISFSGNNLDTATLATFVGASNGFVTTIYDQSSNGRHLVQAVTTSQPRIVGAGAIDLLSNGAPSVLFDGGPWMHWVGPLHTGNSAFLSFQINQYVNNGGIMSLIPPVGQFDWNSARGYTLNTITSPIPSGLRFLNFVNADVSLPTSSTTRQQIGLFRSSGQHSAYFNSQYSSISSYDSAAAGIAEGVGVGSRWEPTGPGFAAAGVRARYRLETLVIYTASQRSNAAAITALL